jgi:flagellar M-ring protein FliF
MLHAPGQSSIGSSSDQMEAKAAFEATLAKNLTDYIATSLGPGQATVTVAATLDMSSGETTTTEFKQPDNIQTPSAQVTETETFTGPGSGANGVLGPDGTPGAVNDTPIDYSKTNTESQFALDTIERTTNDAPGRIERLSVSVLMNADKVEAGDEATWQTALEAAAGIDAARSDVLSIARVPFDEEAVAQVEENLSAAAGEASKTQMLDMIRYVVTLLIVGLVLFLAWRAIKKAEANRVPIRVPLDLRELEAAERRLEPAMAGGAAETPRLPATTETSRPPLDPGNLPVEDEIAGIIEQQPDEVALTLRSWLADRRG